MSWHHAFAVTVRSKAIDRTQDPISRSMYADDAAAAQDQTDQTLLAISAINRLSLQHQGQGHLPFTGLLVLGQSKIETNLHPAHHVRFSLPPLSS